MNPIRVLLIPGLWNSGVEHWQSYWERENEGFVRVEQGDWETPKRPEWVTALDAAVHGAGSDVVLVAHSLGCATVAHWSAQTKYRVKGALLVAPSDVEAPLYPPGTKGFIPMPLEGLPFPSIVAASSDDEYVTLERAQFFAAAWGSRLENIGAAGHINTASNLGSWEQGMKLLRELL